MMIERGAIYAMVENGTYTSKPRPVVVMQNPNVRLDSVIIAPLTSNDAHGEPIRIAVEPSPDNGLTKRSYVMCDKVTAIRASSLNDEPIGRLPTATIKQIQETIYELIDEGVPLD
ncbi:type II toxin-antitoxin system PemK/MazF family toxin [Sinorhizobium sp. BG8]|uniref:type II toxin-antitoxin system PemK/MazF family toxin n=1 Tax=Sinorhizobium sp. BG8 TaxID=2613773 RepID=UPI00193DBBBB|nr:type II toxin-antitoxin system PemK/MazF family toxin [Sinorhizobium sp. BG8]QRM54714.1 type II toxin-antitoxin system PemK/MazF family toxin [Sinorhizobium sp. BG8]